MSCGLKSEWYDILIHSSVTPMEILALQWKASINSDGKPALTPMENYFSHLRPDVPDEHILVVAEEVEKRLLLQLADEGIRLKDATQAGMLVVTMVHNILFEESTVFRADLHEMDHIARVLVDAHSFHLDWPYRDQVKAALTDCYHFQQE